MTSFKNILSIDTALSGCNVGVFHHEQGRVFKTSQAMMRGQAEALVPQIQDVMKDAGLEFNALDMIAVTAGPGAFAGLRIGLSTAKSLALALDIPLLGMGTLEVVAHQALQDEAIIDDAGLAVILETKRSDYYVQTFDRVGAAVSGAVATDVPGIEALCDGEIVLAGDALERFEAEKPNLDIIDRRDIALIDPAFMIDLVQKKIADNLEFPTVEPIYLRGADVSQPKVKPRQLEG